MTTITYLLIYYAILQLIAIAVLIGVAVWVVGKIIKRK
jgi:hypothetical protein